MSFYDPLLEMFGREEKLNIVHEITPKPTFEFLLSVGDASDTPILVTMPFADRAKWFATVEEAVAFINGRIQMKKDVDAKVLELRGRGISIGVRK
jgi:hypothetical protein